MASQNLAELISTLTPEQRDSVEEFVRFLKSKPPASAFDSAVEEFIDDHPELLRRLAQ